MKILLFTLTFVSAMAMAQQDKFDSKVQEELKSFDEKYEQYQHPVLPNKEKAQKLVEWNLERAKLEIALRRDNCDSFNVKCPSSTDDKRIFLRAQYEADMMSAKQKFAERSESTQKPDNFLTKVAKKTHLSREKEYDADEEKNELNTIAATFHATNCEKFKDEQSCAEVPTAQRQEIMLNNGMTLARINGGKPGSKTESGMNTLGSQLQITPSKTPDLKDIKLVVPAKKIELPDTLGRKLDKSIEDEINADYKPESCVWATIARHIVTLPSVMKCGGGDLSSPFSLYSASPFSNSKSFLSSDKPQAVKVQACVGYVVCESKSTSVKTMRMSTCSVESCGKGDAVKCTLESGFHSENVSDDTTSTATREIREAIMGSKAKQQ